MTETTVKPSYQLLKIVIIGDSGVGKSCVLLRFTDDTFSESFINTIGVDFRFKTLEIDGTIIKIQIWDTAGQERFRTITSAYYRGANGIIIVYDTTDRSSFNRVDNWMFEINKYTDDSTFKILIGNKNDLIEEREISTAEGKAKADSLKMEFFETSAKTASNVTEAFHSLTSMVIASRKSRETSTPNQNLLKLSPEPVSHTQTISPSRSCCG